MTAAPVTPDAVEAAARALYDHWRRNSPDVGPWEIASPELQATFTRQATAALAAAAPLIAQQTLLDAAAEVERIDPQWDSALYVDGTYQPVPEWLTARAATLTTKEK